MEFVVVDIETANPSRPSICQIGIVTFANGRIVDEWQSLIDPEDEFFWRNVDIHKIDEDTVKGCPTWNAIYPEVVSRLKGKIVFHHCGSDDKKIERTNERYGQSSIPCVWRDSANVVKTTWKEFSQVGFGLENLAKRFGITFQAHSALEDARCTGLILLKAIEEKGIGVEEWLSQVENGTGLIRTGFKGESLNLDKLNKNSLIGQVVFFTGELSSMDRAKAKEIGSLAGAHVMNSPSLKVTILVKGMLNPGQDGNYRTILERIENGHSITIMEENDFLNIVFSDQP